MAHMHGVRRSLLSALTIATLLSCGPPGQESEPPPAPNARFREATAPDLSPPKGGDSPDALPSVVAPGEVAPFQGMSPVGGAEKVHGAAGALPSTTAEAPPR